MEGLFSSKRMYLCILCIYDCALGFANEFRN